MNDTPREMELWTFGGSRVGKGDKRIHAWIGPDGNEMAFKASGQYSVGSLYRVKVEREGLKVSMFGTPEYTGERAESGLIERLSAKHRATEVTLGMKARERADKRDDPLEEAIGRLVKLAAHVPASQRVAFSAYVTEKLMRGWMG